MAADSRRRKNRTAGDSARYMRDTMKTHPTKNEETVRLRSYGSVGCRRDRESNDRWYPQGGICKKLVRGGLFQTRNTCGHQCGCS